MLQSIRHNLIILSKHAYLITLSVESALHDVDFLDYIEKGLHYKYYMLADFLDIEWALNNIRTEAIKDALELSDTSQLLRRQN